MRPVCCMLAGAGGRGEECLFTQAALAWNYLSLVPRQLVSAGIWETMAGSSITCAVAHWADCRDCDKLNLGWEVYFPWRCSINHMYSYTQAYKPHGICVYKSLNRWLALNFTSTLYIHGECSHGPLFNVVSFCCSFCKTQMIHFSYLLWDGKVRSNVAQKYIDSKCASVLLYCLPLGFPELCRLTC